MSVDDLFFAPVELFATILTIFISLTFINKFMDVFNPIVGNTTPAGEWTTATVGIFNSMAGGFVLALLVGLMITSFILAIKLPISIIWTPIFAVATIVAVWFAVPIASAYNLVVATPTFAAYATHMQVATLIMSNLPYFILLMGCTLGLVTFMKFKQGVTTGL